MKQLLLSFSLLMLCINNVGAAGLKFSRDSIVGKTFYITEESGYDTIAKYYLDNGKLKLFYVIFFGGKLEETDTLDAKINDSGRIEYAVFDRPTELELLSSTNAGYFVKEYHSGQPKNTLMLQSSMPKGFAQLERDKKAGSE